MRMYIFSPVGILKYFNWYITLTNIYVKCWLLTILFNITYTLCIYIAFHAQISFQKSSLFGHASKWVQKMLFVFHTLKNINNTLENLMKTVGSLLAPNSHIYQMLVLVLLQYKKFLSPAFTHRKIIFNKVIHKMKFTIFLRTLYVKL